MKIRYFAGVVGGALLIAAVIQGVPGPRNAGANPDQPPLRRTGAPGGNGTCAGCHNGNTAGRSGTLQFVNLPTEYVPGNTYAIAVAIGDAGQSRWGFELTVLKNSNNSMAGSLQNAIPTLPALPLTGTLAQAGTTYIFQVNNGAVAPGDSNDGTHWGDADASGWVFFWTAPPLGSGPVTFYAAGIAANGDNVDSNLDYTYTNAVSVPEGNPTPVTTTTWGKIKQRYR